MLRINEIYPAILGESRKSGLPGVIVRLTGCHCHCTWCDTVYAREEGDEMERRAVLERIESLALPAVLVTGGEPLLQPEVIFLLEDLLRSGRTVLLETSGVVGGVPLTEVPAGVHRCVDVKTPSSGVAESDIDWDGIGALGGDDDLKFVCLDRADYEWSRDLITGDRLPAGPTRLLSPVSGRLDAAALAEWILADRLDARLQIQLHRILWPRRSRGT